MPTRFQSILDDMSPRPVVIGLWEDVSPVLQRRRKLDGSYEYRPNPARAGGSPNVGVIGEDPREKAIREAKDRSHHLPVSVGKEVVDQLTARVGANIVSTPEILSGVAALADKPYAMQRERRDKAWSDLAERNSLPAPPADTRLSLSDALNPRRLYPDAVREGVEKIYARRDEAATRLAENMAEAGYSPLTSALADTGLEFVAQTAGDITNVLPGIGLLGNRPRAPHPSSRFDAILRPEIRLAEQLPEAPIPATATRGAETLARAMGEPGRETAAPPAGLAPRRPRWAGSHEEALAKWPDFIEGKRDGSPIDPADLPFELRDLPLTRFDEGGAGPLPRGGARFYLLGDEVPYLRPPSPPIGRLERLAMRFNNEVDMTGGPVPHVELFTPENPLVLARTPEMSGSVRGDAALVRQAERAGHDAIVIFNRDPNFNNVEVVKTALAAPGVPRRSPFVEAVSQFKSESAAREAARAGTSREAYESWRYNVDSAHGASYPPYPGDEAMRALREGFSPPARRRLGWPGLLREGASGRAAEGALDDGYIPVHPEATGREIDQALAEARARGFRQAPREMSPALRRFAEGQGLDPDRLDPADPKLLKEYDKAMSPPEPDVPGYFWDAEAGGWRIGDHVFEKRWQAEDLQRRMAKASRDVAEMPLRGIGPGGRFKPSESGHVTLGREPVKADPATEAYRASLFKEKPDSPGPLASLKQAKEALLYEFDNKERAYTRRMTAAGAPEVGEMNALELRRAGHTALMPIHYGTRRWDPSVGEWEMTGPPMEALTHGMDEATARQVETVMQAQSQVEFGRREIAAWQKRMAEDPKTAGPEPVSLARFAEAQQYLREMEASGELAKVEPHAKAARDFEDRAVLQPLVRLGVITEEAANEIRATNAHHAIQMLAEEKVGPELRSGEALGTHSSPLHRREYGLLEDEKYVPTLQAMAIQAARVDKFQVRQMVRNDVARRVLSQPDLWPEFRPARAGETAGTFPFWKDGKKGLIKAPGDFLDVVDNLQPQQVGPLWKVARAAKQTMTTLATLSPHFPGMNFGRDQPSAGVFSRSDKLVGYVPYFSGGKELFKNVYSMFTQGEATRAWKEFQSSAAGHSTFLHADREGMVRVLDEARLRSTPAGRRRLLLRRAANPLFIPDVIGSSLESATRVAEREILLKEGKGAREATTGAAKVSIDFSEGGRTNRKINEVTGFHNVKWLDNSRFLREFFGKNAQGRKFKLAFRASLFVTLPALAEEYLHRDDPDYQNIPLWDQGLFYHFGKTTQGTGPGGLPTGGDFDAGWYKRWPRPQGLLNLVFGILPQLALRQALRDDPHAAEMAVRGLLDGTPLGEIVAQNDQGGTTFSLEAAPTILRGPADVMMNRKWTGAPVVPDDIRSGPPAEQWDERTSPVARRLAGAMPGFAPEPLQSPMQLEHLISTQTAGTGRLALDILNPLARATYGEDEPPHEPLSPRDIPVVRNFMTAAPEGFQSQPVEDLYHLSDRVSALGEMIRRAGTDASGNLTPRADAIGRRYGVDPDGLDGARIDPGEVEDARSQLAEWRDEEAEIVASQIPDDLKRARLRLLRQRVTRFASQQMASWRLRYPTLFK